jgi:hypothetical protein
MVAERYYRGGVVVLDIEGGTIGLAGLMYTIQYITAQSSPPSGTRSDRMRCL